MAVYKLIQDIEAEDKLIGPLSLRQFIYAAIAAVCLYLCFLSIAKHVLFLLLIFLPIALLAGFFAFPFGRDQPTEVWALAKIRFMLIPHKRIWNQSGIKELVTINVPKRVVAVYTDGLSKAQVRSRFQALASTIDTRGWATKNVNVNQFRSGLSSTPVDSDRLIAPTELPQRVADTDVQASDDILDEKNNQTASKFNEMITSSTQQHLDQVRTQTQLGVAGNLPTGSQQPDYWFINQTSGQNPQPSAAGYTSFAPAPVVSSGSTDDNQTPTTTLSSEQEEAIAAQLRARSDASFEAYHQHMKTIEPLSSKKKGHKDSQQHLESTPSPQVTQTPDPAILALANNNDLNVATIARQANQAYKNEPPEDEVVITLH